MVNLAFGWTFFEWFGVLPWAYSTRITEGPRLRLSCPHHKPMCRRRAGCIQRLVPSPHRVYKQSTGGVGVFPKLHANGTLTNAEFDAEKKKILDT